MNKLHKKSSILLLFILFNNFNIITFNNFKPHSFCSIKEKLNNKNFNKRNLILAFSISFFTLMIITKDREGIDQMLKDFKYNLQILMHGGGEYSEGFKHIRLKNILNKEETLLSIADSSNRKNVWQNRDQYEHNFEIYLLSPDLNNFYFEGNKTIFSQEISLDDGYDEKIKEIDCTNNKNFLEIAINNENKKYDLQIKKYDSSSKNIFIDIDDYVIETNLVITNKNLKSKEKELKKIEIVNNNNNNDNYKGVFSLIKNNEEPTVINNKKILAFVYNKNNNLFLKKADFLGLKKIHDKFHQKYKNPIHSNFMQYEKNLKEIIEK